MSELSELRKDLARSLGADVVDPRETDVSERLRELTDGAGADVAFEASGAGAVTLTAAIDGVRSGGTTVLVATAHERVPIDTNVLMQTQKRIVGSLAYTDDDFRDVIAAIDAGLLDPSRLISSTIPLADAVTGGLDFLLGEGRNSEVKILVTP